MKKNLLSVLILALLVVNIAMNAIMMISILSTNSKTGDLVASIATVMNLELFRPGTETVTRNVPLSQTATYSLNDRLMVQLNHSVDADGKPVGADMVTFYMSIAMDTENKDYAKLGSDETLKGLEIEIKDVVASVIQNYTEQECRENFEAIKEEVLYAIQQLFQSDFIYRVSISDVVYQ